MVDPPRTATAVSVAATAAHLTAHASTVGRLRDQQDRAAEAVRHVRLDANAYGYLLSRYLPPAIDSQQRRCDRAIRDASDALHAYARWLEGAADNVTQGRRVSTQALAELAPLTHPGSAERSAQPRFSQPRSAEPRPADRGTPGPVSPLVAPRTDSTRWYSGIGTLETIAVLRHAYDKGSWIEGGLGLAGTAIEATLWVIDPIGMLVAAGFGVFVEHVRPLKEMLDWFAGDPDQINAHAQTWRNIGAAQLAIATGLVEGVRADLPAWEGEAADTYRRHIEEAALDITALGKACEATATWVSRAGALVSVVRTIVRDLVAQVVALLLVRIPLWIAEALATFGIAIPYVAAQITALVARFATQIARVQRALLISMRNLMPLVRQLDDIMLAIGRRLVAGQPLQIHGGPIGPSARTPGPPVPPGPFDSEIDEIIGLAESYDIPINETALRDAALNDPNGFPALAAEVREHLDEVAGGSGGAHVYDEALAEADGLEVRGTPNARTADRAASEVLAESLGAPPGPRSHYEAHHIITVEEGGEMMQVLRTKLDEAGVGRDTAPNGVWLIARQEYPNPTAAMPHNPYIHAGNRAEYEYTLFQRLGHLDGQAFANELATIKRELAEGTFRMMGMY